MPIGTYGSYTPSGAVRSYVVAVGSSPSHGPENTQYLVDSIEKLFASTPTRVVTATTDTFVLPDAGRLVKFNSAVAVAATVPPQSSVAFQYGLATAGILQVYNANTGVVTLTPGAGVTLNGTSLTLGQGDSAVLMQDSAVANTWTVMKGGGIPKASVSGVTGSPTTTTPSGKTCYQWNATGSMTIGSAGLVDVLLVGGGGGGYTGGGGGGQVLYLTNLYLPAGVYATTVGAGGAANGFPGGISSIGSYMAVGGAAGGPNGLSMSGANGGGGASSNPLTTAGGLSVVGGFAGGAAYPATNSHGGGGGAGAVGVSAASSVGGNGGAGVSNSITGSAVTYAGGGGGGTAGGTAGTGGTGGGGAGSTATGTAATANTGGGGGGGHSIGGAAGGSGVVIVLVG